MWRFSNLSTDEITFGRSERRKKIQRNSKTGTQITIIDMICGLILGVLLDLILGLELLRLHWTTVNKIIQ